MWAPPGGLRTRRVGLNTSMQTVSHPTAESESLQQVLPSDVVAVAGAVILTSVADDCDSGGVNVPNDA